MPPYALCPARHAPCLTGPGCASLSPTPHPPPPGTRPIRFPCPPRSKVEQVSDELDSIRASLERFGSRESRRQAEARDRQELLERADAGRQAKREMDEEEAMAGSIGRSKR